MASGLTRKFDFEKGKRQANIQKPDYRERFQDEGENFDRGGQDHKWWKFRPSNIVFSMLPAYQEDKESLVRTLESWKFVVNGKAGTISQLKRYPQMAGREINSRFEIMRRSIMRADQIIGYAQHPSKGKEFAVLEFNCTFRPVDPYPSFIFKRYLAFSPKIVGYGVTGDYGKGVKP